MRLLLLGVLAALALGGCASTLQGVYDEQARTECEQISDASARSACFDRVAQNSRERR